MENVPNQTTIDYNMLQCEFIGAWLDKGGIKKIGRETKIRVGIHK